MVALLSGSRVQRVDPNYVLAGEWEQHQGLVDQAPLLVDCNLHDSPHPAGRLAGCADVCEEVDLVVLLAGMSARRRRKEQLVCSYQGGYERLFLVWRNTR